MLLIDNEKGSRFLIPFFKKHDIQVLVKDTVALADVLQSLQFLKSGEIDFLFIDSLTKVWYQYVREYLAKSGHKFMELQDWGKLLPAWQETFSDRFVDADGNIVFTGRGGFSYEKEEDTKDPETGKVKKGQFVKSGVKMKLAGETPFEPDLNVWMELQQEIGKNGKLSIWREAQVMKDRSGVIDGAILKNPTYKMFQPVVKFIIGVPTGPVNGTSDNTSLAPTEDYGHYARKQAREIEVEKIKGQFEKFALGTTKEEKQVKALILEKCFGTFSATEIEKMDAEILKANRVKMEVLFSAWEGAEDKLSYVKEFDPSKIAADVFDGVFGR